MSLKVDWETDPEIIRRATPIPDIFTPRDYLTIAGIFVLILLIALLIP